jgi:hypothetical protein
MILKLNYLKQTFKKVSKNNMQVFKLIFLNFKYVQFYRKLDKFGYCMDKTVF